VILVGLISLVDGQPAVSQERYNTDDYRAVTGALTGQALTLTAGAEGRHVLTLEITATDADGGIASDDFDLTVGPTEAPGRPAAPATEAGDGQLTVTWNAPADDGGPRSRATTWTSRSRARAGRRGRRC